MPNRDAFVSIFNDVVGPVMRGPSSSHTAGAYRIAQLVRSLYGGLPKTIECAFDPSGSYAPTYLPLGVDKAFCAGLIGLDMLDPAYAAAASRAESQVEISFTVEPLERADHPNAIRVRLYGERNLTIWAKSTGGGIVDLYFMEGFEAGCFDRGEAHTRRTGPTGVPVSITGKSHVGLVLLPEDPGNREAVLRTINAAAALTRANDESTGTVPLVQVTIGEGGLELLQQLRRDYNVDYLLAEPVFYPRTNGAHRDRGPRFHREAPPASAADILKRAESTGLRLGQVAVEFECALLGLSERDAIGEMTRRYEVMRRSVAEGYETDRRSLSWLTTHAGTMKSAFDKGKLPYGGFHTLAAIRAHAVMHTCNSRGVVCAAPTGGSAGVLPGVLMTLEEELGYSRDRVIEALFAAGMVGVVVANRATFAAESAGCQVEIGAAGAMAAAAAVDVAGGSAIAALNAAAISLQNTMGSICDPVGGGCEIPCHTRNGVAAASAFVTADMVFAGYRNPIPLDETIDASYDVGTRLHSDFRCTARGGIAVTPSALRLVRGSEEQR